ncbi:hypothetical protein FA09DRAFT_362765 [Tilletiopsis washingtonensis]|uniref:Deoxyribonuclease NucA/NucB domain-containing protein n=1 Tax=Tilletiopsis washingtonensis TaxID=58919 RepID=A0A316Z684_9BASI|nr:hypothetical protein FA09DRAFT_362765 [Tilletiopsis washingtonensis]PWN95725.1 hypothetical protein FA09DRAFT_362765 [Tilletiopsis washingtonensis]
MLSLRTLLFAALAAVTAASAATVTFDCSRVPNICSNDCYAIRCLGKPTTLTRNSPQAEDNRDANACRSPNRCSGNPSDSNSCDEYPFASTSQGGAGASTRCVPSQENSRQGGTLSSFYTRNSVANGDSYSVAFSNASGLQYCSGSCTNSGNQLVRRLPAFAARQETSIVQTRKLLLASGEEALMFEPVSARGSLNRMVNQTVDLREEAVRVVAVL